MSIELDPERSQFLEILKREIPTMQGKLVKVTARSHHDPAEPAKYSLVHYTGVIQNPGIKRYPESADGRDCLWIQEPSGEKTIYAIDLGAIEEIDDDVKPTAPLVVDMSALQKPTVSQ